MKRIGAWWVPDREMQMADALAGGGWQTAHLHRALDFVTDWRVAVDGGAHVGTWTAGMAARFDRVLAFEPSDEAFDCLAANTAALGNVTRFKAGLADRAGRRALADDDRWGAGNTGGRFMVPGDRVAVLPLDARALPALGLLKLDVEGMEPLALAGAQATLRRCRPVVLFEDKPRFARRYGLAPGAAADLLAGLGARELALAGADRIWGWR